MAITVSARGWTVARALAELPTDAHWEIDEGRLEMHEPPAPYHGAGMARVTILLGQFVTAGHLGQVLAGDPGFWLARSPDTLRAPDVAFLTQERWAAITDPDTFAEVAPDLAVEIVSPSDRAADLCRKAAQYLAFGVRSVWILDPRRRRLEQYISGRGTRTYEDDACEVEDPSCPASGAPWRISCRRCSSNAECRNRTGPAPLKGFASPARTPTHGFTDRGLPSRGSAVLVDTNFWIRRSPLVR